MAKPSSSAPPLVRAEAATDTGRVRGHNEDFFLLAPEARLYLLADGMGGHNAGEVASRLALEAARDAFVAAPKNAPAPAPDATPSPLPPAAHHLRAALKAANTRVLEESRATRERQGMGTTVVALCLDDGKAAIAHMGDSRVYRLREMNFDQLTDDHSLVQEQVRMGILSQAQAHASPHKNVITRACGIREGVEPDLRVETVRAGDVFLLCSDGLSNLVSDQEMARILSSSRSDLARACRDLIAAANDAGGDDNITVVAVAVDRP